MGLNTISARSMIIPYVLKKSRMRMAGKFEIYIFSIAICLLWFAAVFDPIGKFFMLRYVALASALACLVLAGLFWKLFDPNISLQNTIIIYVSFLMPMYGFLVYAMRGGYTTKLLDTSYAAASILLLFSFLYKNENLCKVGIRAMIFSLRLLVVVIVLIYAATILGFNIEWIKFFTEGDAARVSTRDYAGINLPYIYFLASPMLIYLIAYDLNKFFGAFSTKNALTCGASIFAFALSGTRAHIILAFVYPLLFYSLIFSRHKFILIVTSVLVIVLTIGLFNFEILNAFFTTKETSNSMKVGMLTKYADMFSDPLTVIFGQGYNAHAWSTSLREIIAIEENASKSELTYIELVRVYGLFISLPFFILFGALVYKLSRVSFEYRWLYPAFLIYLINSFLNPYLFSTNGILPLGLILAIVSLKRVSNPLVKYPNKFSVRG